MKRIGIYLRCSTERQDLLMQIDAIDKWLNDQPKSKQPESIRRFQDEGKSGKDDNRVGFQSLLKACRNGEIDTVVVYKIDRLTRSTATAIRTILDLDALGVAFVSTSQPILNLGHDMPFRMTMLSAFAEISQIEREVTVARVKAGLDSARKKGKKLGRPKVSTFKSERIKKLKAAGFGKQAIAHQVGVSRPTVNKVLKEA